MMCLSQTAGYAIHALSLVANGGGRLCLIREIATLSGIPKPYLAKIVNQLTRVGLVAAKRGYRGGIYLTRHPREISLLEVVEAIDGKDFIAECMLGLSDCSTPCLCPTHDVWCRLREEIRSALSQASLADILQPSAPETLPAQRSRKGAGRAVLKKPAKSGGRSHPPPPCSCPCSGGCH